MGRRWSDDEKAAAVDAYVTTGNLAEGQRAVRTPEGDTPGKTTIKTWAVAAGHDLEEITARAVAKTKEATAAQLRKWQERRADMLHEVGGAAQLALDSSVACMAIGDPSAAKDYATTCAIFIDKAQLLAGDPTASIRAIPWDSEIMDRVKEQARTDGENVRPLRAV